MRVRLPFILLTALQLDFVGDRQQLLAADPASLRPTIGEFLGVNGHTIQFKPDLYGQVCRKVRDYHSFEWDMGNDTDFVPRFPEARNRVNWDHVFGSRQKAGFETDVCVMFNNTPPDSWKDLARDTHAYGLAFAKAFGSSSQKKLVSSVEIGNEPGRYRDDKYRELFQSMAGGLRAGDRPFHARRKSYLCLDGSVRRSFRGAGGATRRAKPLGQSTRSPAGC